MLECILVTMQYFFINNCHQCDGEFMGLNEGSQHPQGSYRVLRACAFTALVLGVLLVYKLQHEVLENSKSFLRGK